MNIDFSLLEEIADSPHSALDSDDMDRLVRLQSAKADLVAQRDALAAKKRDLISGAARLRETLHHYEQQQHQRDTRLRLDYYLRQNDAEHAQLAQPDAAAEFVLENAGVLPSKNWGRRLEQAARFCPGVTLSRCVARAVHDGEGRLVSERCFTLSARGLPSVDVCMHVADSAVLQLWVANWLQIEAALSTVCSSMALFWRRNVLPQRKLDLLVASYAALVRAHLLRLEALAQLAAAYPDQMSRPATSTVPTSTDKRTTTDTLTTNDTPKTTQEPPAAQTAGNTHSPNDQTVQLKDTSSQPLQASPTSKQEIEPPIVSLLELSNAPYVEWTFGGSRVRLLWRMVLASAITGAVLLELCLVIVHPDGSVLDADAVFQRLVETYGVVEAFKVMMLNMFGV